MDDTSPAFGELLRRARQAAGLSQGDLAARTGLSERGLSDLERGVRRRPRPGTIDRLANALGLPPPTRAAWFAAARGSSSPDSLWPRPLTSFIGRAAEITSIAALAHHRNSRLITLIGPGGVGKTRLALKVAEEAAGSFPGGIWFVALAPVRDATLVAATVADAIGVRSIGSQGVETAVGQYLAGRQALIVLDNFEHVLDAGPILVEWLAACPNLVILVTSRAVLRLSGEHVVDVSPMSLPPPGPDTKPNIILDSEAVRLFIDRASAARHDLVTGPADLADIATICAHLDGLPLAIELAAARARLIPPGTLLALLERRLEVLTEGPRDQPLRLRSLRDAIAWRYDLLAPAEQCLFRRLAVFVGGFNLAGASAVADSDPAVLAKVTALADASLLRPVEQRDAGADTVPRYTMLETIREFGLEQLVLNHEDTKVREKHADHFFAVVEAATPTPRWPPSESRVRLITAERGNLRATLAWLDRTGDVERYLVLATRIFPLWYSLGNIDEGFRCLERGLAYDGELPTALRAVALSHAAALIRMLGEHERALPMAKEALALAGTVDNPSLDDRFDAALTLRIIGDTLMERGQYAEGELYLARSLEAFRILGSDANASYSLGHMGLCAFGQDDLVRARECCDQALAMARASGTTWATAKAVSYLGLVTAASDHLASVASTISEAFEVGNTAVDLMGSPYRLIGLAILAMRIGAPMTAARSLGAAEAQAMALGVPLQLPLLAAHERGCDTTRAALGDCGFAAGWAEGQAMTLEETTMEAHAVIAMAEASPHRAGSVHSLANHGLTPREVEVVRLVADGMSNREIANTLYISIPTVKRHLSTIFGKIGVTSRVEASEYVHSHGFDSASAPEE